MSQHEERKAALEEKVKKVLTEIGTRLEQRELEYHEEYPQAMFYATRRQGILETEVEEYNLIKKGGYKEFKTTRVVEVWCHQLMPVLNVTTIDGLRSRYIKKGEIELSAAASQDVNEYKRIMESIENEIVQKVVRECSEYQIPNNEINDYIQYILKQSTLKENWFSTLKQIQHIAVIGEKVRKELQPEERRGGYEKPHMVGQYFLSDIEGVVRKLREKE